MDRAWLRILFGLILCSFTWFSLISRSPAIVYETPAFLRANITLSQMPVEVNTTTLSQYHDNGPKDTFHVTDASLRHSIKSLGYLPEMCTINQTGNSWLNCSFPQLNTTIRSCFTSKGIKRVVIFGDSQGRRMLDKFAGLVRTPRSPCVTSRVSSHRRVKGKLNVDYYIRNKSWNYKLGGSRDTFCTSCDGITKSCQGLSLEYIGIYSLNKTAITIPPEAKTFWEFLIKFYLKGRDPDLVIFEIPLNHLKDVTEETFGQLLSHDIDVMMTSLSKTKKFVILPGLSEQEERRRLTNSPFYMKKWLGELANDRIYKLNRELARVFKEEKYIDDPRLMTFINLHNATRDLLSHSPDGIHYSNRVYSLILRTVFAMLCEGL